MARPKAAPVAITVELGIRECSEGRSTGHCRCDIDERVAIAGGEACRTRARSSGVGAPRHRVEDLAALQASLGRRMASKGKGNVEL